MQLPCCCHAVAMQLQDFVHISCRTGKGIAVRQLPCCYQAVAILVNNSLLHGHMWDFPHVFCRAGRGIAAEYFVSSLLSMKVALMYLPHRKQNCRCTTAEVPLLGRIIFSKIVSQCFDKSFKLDPFCLTPHNDCLLPLQHNWDLMYVGKMCEVVDVQMDVNVVAMLLPFS